MAAFKQRSDLLKDIAGKVKMIGHGRPVAEGSDQLRNSYFRLNDEEELNSAIVNGINFPAVIHAGYDVNFRQSTPGMPRRTTTTHLLFFAMLDLTTYPVKVDAIEAAFDEAYEAMAKFIAYMLEEHEVSGACGNFLLFDLNKATATQVWQEKDNLYGWQFVFVEEDKARDLKYNPEDYYDD